MNSDEVGWIDPAVVLKLMREYQQRLGTRGALQMEGNILMHTGEDISRKTLENWLAGREKKPRPRTLYVARKFVRTKHFYSVVPQAEDYLGADARLHRIGSALFALHGAHDLNAAELTWLNKATTGWWVSRDTSAERPSSRGFICITPVPDQPFSKMCIWLPNAFPHVESPPKGSGIIFPKAGAKGRAGAPFTKPPFGSTIGFPKKGSATDFGYMARLWLNDDLQERPMQVVYHHDKFSENLFIHHWLRESPQNFVQNHFSRADESMIPESIRATFEEWSYDAIPQGLEANREK